MKLELMLGNNPISKCSQMCPMTDDGSISDEAHLLKFLRGCKFSLERTKEKIDFYSACQANAPAWFSSWDMESPTFQKFLDWGFFLPLPGFDKHGRQVILLRSGQIVPAKTNIEEWLTVSKVAMTKSKQRKYCR